MNPSWLNLQDCLTIHDRSLAQFGGADGVRDNGLLESAISRPRQLFHYEKANLYELAASYTYALIKNHPFIDGNKRTGFIAGALFLQMNGKKLISSEQDALTFTVALAASDITEKDYANWLSKSCQDV